MYWRRFCKTSWRCLEDVLKTSSQDVLKTSWKRLENVLKTYDQDDYVGLDEDVSKTSSEDVWVWRIYSSWSIRFEDVFWRRRRKAPSRRLHQDECLLGLFFYRLWLCYKRNFCYSFLLVRQCNCIYFLQIKGHKTWARPSSLFSLRLIDKVQFCLGLSKRFAAFKLNLLITNH